MQHYLRHSTFSRFDTIPECDRHTQTHDDDIYLASIASRGKNGQIFNFCSKAGRYQTRKPIQYKSRKAVKNVKSL